MAKLIPVGFFRELRHGKPNGPSLRQSVAKEAAPDEAKVVAYLKAGKLLVAAPGIVKDALAPAGPIGSASILTDGAYAWPEDFAYYVARYHVRPPADFAAHMASRDWQVPSDLAVAGLEL